MGPPLEIVVVPIAQGSLGHTQKRGGIRHVAGANQPGRSSQEAFGRMRAFGQKLPPPVLNDMNKMMAPIKEFMTLFQAGKMAEAVVSMDKAFAANPLIEASYGVTKLVALSQSGGDADEKIEHANGGAGGILARRRSVTPHGRGFARASSLDH